ncbi:nesprin-2a [Genypterus blacodes]|uniref:nesprin-2a n=1 Tax=Genypterus blacodes TaxID=154954 RepID=UPI003F75A79D
MEGREEVDGGIPLDIDGVHTFLHVEPERIQMQTVTHVQLSKGSSCKPVTPASIPSQNDQLLPAPVGPMPLNPLPPTADTSTEEKESSSPSQMSEFKVSGQPNKPQSSETSPQPPPTLQNEACAKARAVARSRMEKTRVSVQQRIQQAITLFADKEISEWQAERKERALRILQPVVLEEFLGAVEDFGGFCSVDQLQDLILLSDAVRKQWEDVIAAMGAYLPILWSKIRERKPPFSDVESEMHANALHAATDPTDPTDHEHVSQQQALSEGAAFTEDDAGSLHELYERLTPVNKVCQASNQKRESDGGREESRSQRSDSAVPADSRGPQHRGNVPQSDQHGQAHTQAVTRSDTVEPQQPQEEEEEEEEECTFIPQAVDSCGQAALSRYDMMDSAEDQMDLIAHKLEQIIREPVDISSLTLADVRLESELQEMKDGLQHEMRKLRGRGTAEEEQDFGAISPTPLCQTPYNQMGQLRQQLERVESAAQALQHFLNTLKRAKAEISVLVNKQTDQQQNQADWEQERLSWEEAMQRTKMAAEQSDVVDGLMKAAGMTLIMDDAKVTCGDVAASFARQLEDVDQELTSRRKKGEEQIQEHEDLRNPVEEESPLQQTPAVMEPDEALQTKTNRRRGKTTEGKRGGEKRLSLLVALRKIQGEAEHLGLQEATLPALQLRMRVFTGHQSRLARHLDELQDLRDAASQAGVADFNQTRDVEDLWEETKRAVSDRLEQCGVLTELLKRFVSVRGELRGALQRAEGTIRERASYMGKENLQRRHTTIQEIKADLSGLGAGVEDFRVVCRQLQTHQRQIPECTAIPFEEEADALMDRWLDVSERTDSHLDDTQHGLTLWEGLLQLGLEVENWAANKLDMFTQSSCFQKEGDVKVLQTEIHAQEENMECFHRRAAEIQTLLQSTEPLLELQVVESHTRQKMEQVKELFSEAEEVFRQMVATRDHVAAQMFQCQNSLQNSHDSLVAFDGSDAVPANTNLKDIKCQLQSQEEQIESLLEDVHVMASIVSPENLRSLAAGAIQLQETLRDAQQLLCQVEEQTESDAKALHRLQWETECLGQWLQATEEKAAKEEDFILLQEEILQQRERTEALSQLVSSLQSSQLQVSVEESLTLLERYHSFRTNILMESTGKRNSVAGDTEMIQAQEDCIQGSVERSRHGAPEQEVTGTEQSPLDVEVKQSISTNETSLLNHKGAVESCAGDVLAQAEEDRKHKVQAREEATCVQTAVKELSERLGDLCVKDEASPDISRLKQHWDTIQDNVARATELAAKLSNLQNTEWSAAQETTIDAAAKDLESPGTAFLQKKQECVDNTANSFKEAIRQLQQWSQTEQAPSQEMLDEGLEFQRALQSVLSQPDFLLNCLGTKLIKKLEKRALNATNTSATLIRTVSKRLQSEEEVDLLGNTDEDICGCGSESPLSIPAALASVMCPPASHHPSAVDYKENSEPAEDTLRASSLRTEQDQAEISAMCIAGSLMETASEDASVPYQVPHTSLPQLATVILQTDLKQQPPDGPLVLEPLQVGLKDDGSVSNTDGRALEASHTPPVNKIEALALDSLVQQEDAQRRATTSALDLKWQIVYRSGAMASAHCVTSLESVSSVSPAVGEEILGVSPLRGVSCCKSGPREQQQQNTDISSTVFLKASQVSELKEVTSPSAQTQSDNCQSPDLKHSEGLNSNSSSWCDAVSASATAACPGVERIEPTELLHIEEQVESSGDRSVQGDVSTQLQPAAPDSPHVSAKAAQVTVEVKERKITQQVRDLERTEYSHLSERKDDALHTTTGRETKLPASLEDTETTQRQIQEGMEPGRSGLSPAADLGTGEGTGEGTGGSPEDLTHRSTMLDIMSDIQSLVEKSNIINRTQHIDLNWFLESSPGEPEIQLVRTNQKVLACRYQPAQLNVTAMAKQLKEAEDYKLCVLEQIATISCMSAYRVCDPDALKAVEGQCSAALLDASATVQVKAAQLDQVNRYHKKTKMIRALLEVLACEKEKISLDILGSSVLQVQKLRVLLQTMERKKGKMEELLRLSSELSVHLSDAESSGVLLAQLGDIHEEWRLLECSFKRALRHASNSVSQSSLLIKDTKQLQAKVEAFLNTFIQFSEKTHEGRCSIEWICLITDLKLYNQLYLHLQSQSDALGHFSLGQKEKEEGELVLQALRSLLDVTKSKMDTSTCNTPGTCSPKLSVQLRDLVIWAKQAHIHISVGETLSLFPEEARIQIAEMRRIQTDILSQRSKLQAEVDDMNTKASHMDKEEADQVRASLKMVEDLYDAIAASSACALDTMEKTLQQREKLFHQLAHMDAWLAETHATRDQCPHVENVSKANIRKLQSELTTHKQATAEVEKQLELVDALTDSCEKTAVGLSPSESRYLVNRVSGLWTELDGLLAHEKATSWELDELIHERTISDEELSTIQGSLQRISTDLEQQRFPLTKDTVSIMTLLKHMLMEHQWQVQELQHCQEAKRSSLLCKIGELQDKCKALSLHAFKQDKYLHLRNQMEESRNIAEAQVQQAKDEAVSVGQRFRLCQTLLVELPLVRQQCQEAADQLGTISQELDPAELNSERQNICGTVETLVSCEQSVTNNIKILDRELLGGPSFCSELSGLTELFQRAKAELEGAEPATPDEKTIDVALRRSWVILRNAESGLRILGDFGQKEKRNLRNQEGLCSLMDATKQACHVRMESLSHARESLKDYHWAAQGAIGFLHNAEATFLSAPGGFLDCLEEQKQTEEALATLEEGFQAHISHLVELVPQQQCLSRLKMEQLHVGILSQLLVGRAVLEAQAQLRLGSLQSCAKKVKGHRNYHEDVRQLLSKCESRLTGCAAEQVTSYDKCLDQQNRAKLLMEDLHALAGKIDELTAGCPIQSCGVGKDGELGALWRRWVSLRRGVGLLMAHSEQRGEEWQDITTSMEHRCSVLAALQSEVSQISSGFAQGEPQELLNQAEMHQNSLEQEQQALASLEHRLEHALSLSCSQDCGDPGPFGKRLVRIQEDVRSLKEKNLLVVAAAQQEENERQQVQKEIEELQRDLFAIRHSMEACWEPCKQRELRKDLSSQEAKLRRIVDSLQNRYADEIPAEVHKHIEEVQLSLERAEEEMVERSDAVRKLSRRVAELGFGLERVKNLLEQQSPTVTDAQKSLKHVWDELDAWHSRLTLLQCEVQDLAEEQPNQAHLLMDQLTQPLQLYQNAAQMAEHRTAFLSKIPACLNEFEDIIYSATSWLDEALPWLTFPFTYTTAKNLQGHANSLQLVLDDSERIRATLRGFRPVLGEISAVCDISAHEDRLDRNNQQIINVQRDIEGSLEQIRQAVPVLDAVEAELKSMEKDVTKIRIILSSVSNSSISLSEHLHNQQAILANVQSMQRTLEEMEGCRGETGLPQGAEESLLIFSKAKLLLPQLQELGELAQQQVAQLEEKMGREEHCKEEGEEEGEDSVESGEDLGVIAVEASHLLGGTQLLDGSLQENFEQEALELPTTAEEQEEKEEDDRPHSSSSGTLTSSIAEDPEDTLQDQDIIDGQTDVQHENNPNPDTDTHSQEKTMDSSGCELCTNMETSSQSAEAGLISLQPELDTEELTSENTGLATTESGLWSVTDMSEASGPETVTAEPRSIAALSTVSASEEQHPASAMPKMHGCQKYELVDAETQTSAVCHRAKAAVEDTRFVPLRPITPFTPTRATEGEFIEDEHLSSSTAPHQHLEQIENEDSRKVFVEGSHQPSESSEIRMTSEEEEDEEKQRWSRFHYQIAQKFTTLQKVQDEHQAMGKGRKNEKVPEMELEMSVCAAAVIRQAGESITSLRQLGSSAGGAHPGVKKDLYEALRKVLLCLDALTDLLLTPVGSGEDDANMRLLQHESVSAELLTLAGVLRNVESEAGPWLQREEPEACQCLSGIQGCVSTVQLVLASSQKQLLAHLCLTQQRQISSSQICVFDDFVVAQCETFPSLKDAPGLEFVLGRHLTSECPEAKAKLQQASQALLQGIARILEVCAESLASKQNIVRNRSQIQAVLQNHKKVLRVLGSHLAFAQHLFKSEPEALKHREVELVQLEIRAKALQQQALEQEVDSQRKLQDWSHWEEDCGGLGRLLDELETFISCGQTEGEDEEEVVTQQRLHACQDTLVQLDQSRATLGSILDQEKVLQTWPPSAASVYPAGGALELRWRNVYRRAEQEIQRCQDIQDSRSRFQTDLASVSEWLDGAKQRLEIWSDLADGSDMSQECVQSCLIKLLDFSMEMEGRSVQKATASKLAALLLRLREADCPGLQAQLAQLEMSWSQLTSDLSKTQERLQPQLLEGWPPLGLLSELEDWLKKLQSRLGEEKEAVTLAQDAAQVMEVLQHYQEMKSGLGDGRLLLDFLCQSGPRVVPADIQALGSQRTMFPERLGALRLQWLHLQGELGGQVHAAEQIHHRCADRERRLQRLRSWMVQQKEKLNEWKQPPSQTLACKALLEQEAVAGRAREVTVALQELRAVRVHNEEGGEGEEHVCDVVFAGLAESVDHVCADISQELDAQRAALQETVEQWSCYEKNLNEVSIRATRMRCALQHGAPLFSLKQAKERMELLQGLKETAAGGEEIWTAVDKSYESLHRGTAHNSLANRIEEERQRWKDAVHKVEEELGKTEETLSLWQDYIRLSDCCSLQLRGQWEVLWSCSLSHRQGTEAMVQLLQKVTEDLQQSVSDAFAASKSLIGHLEPPAVNLIQSDTELLSHDVLLLSRALSGRKICLQEDLEQQETLHTCLAVLENELQNILHEVKPSMNDTNSVTVLSELSDLLLSLLDVSETSGHVSHGNQEKERLRVLSGRWIEGMTCASHMNREMQSERWQSQNFQQKCKRLTSIQEKLEQKAVTKRPHGLQEKLAAHQRLQADLLVGQQLLQSLLCDAVESLEKQTGEEKSELMGEVIRVKESWFTSVAQVEQSRVLVKEQLSQWRVYQCGKKILWKLLRNVDPLLNPVGSATYPLQHQQSCVDQCVRETLDLHGDVYTLTLEAGRQLHDGATESRYRSRLQSELQALQEAWDRTASLLGGRRALADTAAQKWSQCQDGINNCVHHLDEMKQLPDRLEQFEEETCIQEAELSLEHLASGLRELATMKTDMFQYVAAGDSALLEQQLDQLHCQWEELCMKVSLRRQEVADRLNAWTIFNDKNKELCDWLTQMDNKVSHSGDLRIEEMVEKLKKDCMEEINLFSENKSHLKRLGEQLLSASDETKQSHVNGSLQEVNQRWNSLFLHIESRVKKLSETLVTVQQLDKNMSNLRSWLSRIEAELSRPITYSFCHHQEIQRRLDEQQELQRDIEQHTQGVASVLSLCDVLLQDEDARGGTEDESDSLLETSRSLDQRWRTICAMALDRRLRIEETWRLWCKFLDDYSRLEDWLKMAERTAANPNSSDVLYTVAKEELKKFEGFQRQVHERLTELELINHQYRRLARENRTDRASNLKVMVHEGNRRWDALHRRVGAVLRRLKHFTSQREDFESTKDSMLVWLTELDLQLTNVEHFSESDIHHKIQQLNGFQQEITLNTERIDGLIVFGEGLIQKSSPQDAALIEDELEELHSYCQGVFSRLVCFHQRLSQPVVIADEPELSATSLSLERSLEPIGCARLGRSRQSLPATPTRLLSSPLERSGRETPVSVDSLPLEWDHTGDVGGSSHEDEEEEEEGSYFSALSEVDLVESQEEFVEAQEALGASSLVPSRSMVMHESERWQTPGQPENVLLHPELTLTSTPLKQGFMRLMSQCSGSIQDIRRVSLILDDQEQPEEIGLTGLRTSEQQSGVIERWELLQAQARSERPSGPEEPQQLASDLDDVTSWLGRVIPELERLSHCDPAVSMEDMTTRAKHLKEMEKEFSRYKSIMLSVNLRGRKAPDLQHGLASANRGWSRACSGLQQWDGGLRKTLMHCQEFHESLHSLLLWLAHAESRLYAVDINNPHTPIRSLRQHCATLTNVQEELRGRQAQQDSLQALWSQLRPEEGAEEGDDEAWEKLHVTGAKLKLLLRQATQDHSSLQQRLECGSVPSSAAEGDVQAQSACKESQEHSPSTPREMGKRHPRRSFFYRVLRAAFPLHLLMLLLLLLPCVIPLPESDPGCNMANNFARSFYPMLSYTNGPPPT